MSSIKRILVTELTALQQFIAAHICARQISSEETISCQQESCNLKRFHLQADKFLQY